MPLVTPNADDGDRSVRRLKTCHVDDLLAFALKIRGADVHLAVGLPPVIRVDGKLFRSPYEPVTSEISERLVYDILTDQQIREFESGKDLDFTYSGGRISDFRVRVFRHNGTVASIFHMIKQA